MKLIYAFEDFHLDVSRKILFRLPDKEPVPITHKALEVLLLLVENRGVVVTKDELMTKVWADSIVEEANLTQTISMLRKTLGENPSEHRFIVTETGKGYRFVATVEILSEIYVAQDERLSELKLIDHQQNAPQKRNTIARNPYVLAAAAFLVFAGFNNRVFFVEQTGNADFAAFICKRSSINCRFAV